MTERMRPSRGAYNPSALALNPTNLADSAARRERLLAAFDSLDVNDRADLLEAVETIVHSARAASSPTEELRVGRQVMRRVYAEAGWDE